MYNKTRAPRRGNGNYYDMAASRVGVGRLIIMVRFRVRAMATATATARVEVT